MSITQEQLEQIKAQHAGTALEVLENPITEDVLVCKSPGVEWTRYRSETDGKSFMVRQAAGKTLILCCAVWPAREEVERMLADRPGLIDTFAAELGEMAGSTARASHRKL
jgi:hypothetical protein